jgi:hypothetical protein
MYLVMVMAVGVVVQVERQARQQLMAVTVAQAFLLVLQAHQLAVLVVGVAQGIFLVQVLLVALELPAVEMDKMEVELLLLVVHQIQVVVGVVVKITQVVVAAPA